MHCCMCYISCPWLVSYEMDWVRKHRGKIPGGDRIFIRSKHLLVAIEAWSRSDFSSNRHLEMWVSRAEWQPEDYEGWSKVCGVCMHLYKSPELPVTVSVAEAGASCILENSKFKQVGSELWGDTAADPERWFMDRLRLVGTKPNLWRGWAMWGVG